MPLTGSPSSFLMDCPYHLRIASLAFSAHIFWCLIP
jgi:hypothetical protein